jgi:hypothetical protein
MGYLGILVPQDVRWRRRTILNWFVGDDEKYVLVVNDRTLIDWIRLKDRGGDVTAAIGHRPISTARSERASMSAVQRP